MSEHEEQLDNVWVERLLGWMIVLALLHGAAMHWGTSAGNVAGVLGLIVLALFSMVSASSRRVSSRDWQDYLSHGKRPFQSVAAPRFSGIAFLALVVLSGILYGVYWYLGEQDPRLQSYWLRSTGFYLWGLAWSVAAVLVARRSPRWSSSPSLVAGAGASAAAILWVVATYYLQRQEHSPQPTETWLMEILLCVGVTSVLTGSLIGMPIGALMLSYSNPQHRPSTKQNAGTVGRISAFEHLLCALPLPLVAIGGLIGGIAGGCAYGINLSICRSSMPKSSKIIWVLTTTSVAYGLFYYVVVELLGRHLNFVQG